MIDVRAYGAVGDGVTDDTAAFIAAVAALTPFSMLRIPSGNYCIASASITANQLTLPCDHVSVVGDGRFSSRITMTGTAIPSFIFGSFANNGLEYHNLGFYGNNQADGFANGAAISWKNVGATADIRGFSVHNCHFENFKGDFWIYAENTAGTYAMLDASVTDCSFVSKTGNSRAPTLVSAPQGCVGLFGHATNSAGLISGINISRNYANCEHIKGFASLFNAITNYSIVDNSITGSGTDTAFADNSACYAIIVYAAVATGPTCGVISHNRINGVRDVGIYALENHNVTITGNVIRNQTSVADATLPKCAIAANGCRLATITGNSIETCVSGIFFEGSLLNSDTDSVITGNTIRTCSKFIVRIESSTYGWSGLTISGNTLHGSSMGISLSVNATQPVSGITIGANQITAGTVAIDVASGNGTYGLTDINIIGNTIISSGSMTAYISCVLFQNTTTNIIGNVISGNCVSGIDVRVNKKLNIIGNAFHDVTSGACFLVIQAEGCMWGNTFTNVTQACTVSVQDPTDLGRLKPTFTGTYGQRVQNLIPAETGSSGSKYITHGWVYNGGWLDQRAYTGN